MIELLAPAGNLERLKTAIYFGADAVYIGGSAFGLRAKAKNFTFGCAFFHTGTYLDTEYPRAT